MHKLNRPAEPACLRSYRHGRDNWADVSSGDKVDIWQQLETMQGLRCAYCEDALRDDKRHIEHFQQRSRNVAITFAWDNIFGSCNKPGSCGKHKDLQHYNAHDLIKPDIDDPEEYLQFLSTGRIVPQNELNPDQQRKAEETLRIFNLDHDRGPLRQMRQSAVAGYIQQAEELAEFATILDPDEFDHYRNGEVAAIADLPFATAIKHVLTGLLP